ncbi:hypothetical protein F5148DRAFT_106677 [Russula earlei]|uniref:Uncharacterized protein n=1 Tax=Russula earlei TaxID=71964 RepID=A0ACC0TRN7_9AGAM|nr:hypothetical protein F5148DRAFT_106677 [Russula earlei]
MSRLEYLCVEFESPRYPESRHPLSLTRSVLSSLTKLVFEGAHQYLEDLLVQIEAPLLGQLKIRFFMDPHFVVPQLHELISYAESFKKCHEATLYISDHEINFRAFRETRDTRSPELFLNIRGGELTQRFSSFAQVFNSSLSLLSTLEQLNFLDDSTQCYKNGIETTQWLQVLALFTSVTDLCLDYRLKPHICRVLEELIEESPTSTPEHFFVRLRAIGICS